MTVALLALLLCLIVPLAVHAQASPQTLKVGDTLPPLEGEFLTGRDAVLPAAASGRIALLALGFSYDSRFAVEDWVKKFRARFEKEPRVTFFEVPMISGMARLGKWFIDSGMRRGTPKEDHENVITVYGGAGPWKERLEYSDPGAAYLVLLDPDGKVLWRYNGRMDETAFRQLAAEVSTLLAAAP